MKKEDIIQIRLDILKVRNDILWAVLIIAGIIMGAIGTLHEVPYNIIFGVISIIVIIYAMKLTASGNKIK